MRVITRKHLREIADINDASCHACSFPFFESTRTIYACHGKNHCIAVGRIGEQSGLLYCIEDIYSNDHAGGYEMYTALGFRERDIIDNLASCKELQHDGAKFSVMEFKARDGRTFAAVTENYGRTWRVCN